MSFYVGQKVVCVDDSGLTTKKGPRIYKNIVYVVRDVSVCPLTDELGLLLIGIRCKIHPIWEREYGFHIRRFRPLDELKAETAKRNRILTEHITQLAKKGYV